MGSPADAVLYTASAHASISGRSSSGSQFARTRWRPRASARAQTFARSVKLSDKLKKLYLDFWKLDVPYTDTGSADFTTQAPTGLYYPKSSARKKDAKATA